MLVAQYKLGRRQRLAFDNHSFWKSLSPVAMIRRCSRHFYYNISIYIYIVNVGRALGINVTATYGGPLSRQSNVRGGECREV